MPDWTSSMQQTFEYYTVNPSTWNDEKRLDTVKSCTISRDADAETLGSATIDVIESVGECYIRVYLVTLQNGVTERFSLGTFLAQTPSSSFDGKVRTVSMDAYTPLIELKENPVPLGYYIAKNENVMDTVYKIAKEHMRAPVVKTECDTVLYDDFVADTSDTWLSYLTDLAAYAKYSFSLDEKGQALFAPNQDTASLQPVWTYNDDNSSILYPELDLEHDIYEIPNVVEVIYSSGSRTYTATAVNNDSNSPTSTVNRGREIIYRDTSPSLTCNPDSSVFETTLNEYANQLLSDLSTVEYSVSYSHGYCPVRLGDCVRLNYTKAGIEDIRAKVVSQSIKCETGCAVSEKAVFTTKLWG